MITIPLRILLVEDFKTDAELITYHIQQIVEKPEIKIVSNFEDVKKELLHFFPDVVLSDYNLPGFTGLDVLKLTKEIHPNLPVIFITGTIQDEELAANTILSGASGFILKKNMNSMQEKLKPLLKMVIFRMDQTIEVRERLRKNKIAVNQIYEYINTINVDNEDHKQTLNDIKDSMDRIKKDSDVE